MATYAQQDDYTAHITTLNKSIVPKCFVRLGIFVPKNKEVHCRSPPTVLSNQFNKHILKGW